MPHSPREMSPLTRLSTLSLLALSAVANLCAAQETKPAPLVDLDVPFVVSPAKVTKAMLDIANVDKSDFVLDLGSGDGRIVIAAAEHYGARGMGVEIDPELVKVATRNAQAAGVAKRASFRVQDLFETDLSQASVITIYLLPDVNLALRPKLLQLKPGTRIVSHDWDMGDWLPDARTVIGLPDKKLGKEKSSKIMLWVVPARIEGRWCSDKGAQLDIVQRYQDIEGLLVYPPHDAKAAAVPITFTARVNADRFSIVDAREMASVAATAYAPEYSPGPPTQVTQLTLTSAAQKGAPEHRFRRSADATKACPRATLASVNSTGDLSGAGAQ